MPLDADAAALAAGFQDLMPKSWHGLGVAAGRALNLLPDAPPPPAVSSVEDRNVPGPHGDVPVRVYRPDGRADLPVLVYVHGGGWAIGSLAGADAVCRALCLRAECVVVSVDYRQAPEHPFPVPVDDCHAALRWVADHTAEIGGDASRIAVGGDSAGGNLAAVLAQLARDGQGPRLVAQLLVYPATEYPVPRPSWTDHAHAPVLTAADTVWFWDMYVTDEGDRTDPRASPAAAKSLQDLPPAIVLTAEYDPIRDAGEAYACSLSEAGVPVFQKRYPGAFHGFFSMVGALERTEEAVADAARQLSIAFERK